jgi:hypothetical protein
MLLAGIGFVVRIAFARRTGPRAGGSDRDATPHRARDLTPTTSHH